MKAFLKGKAGVWGQLLVQFPWRCQTLTKFSLPFRLFLQEMSLENEWKRPTDIRLGPMPLLTLLPHSFVPFLVSSIFSCPLGPHHKLVHPFQLSPFHCANFRCPPFGQCQIPLIIIPFKNPIFWHPSLAQNSQPRPLHKFHFLFVIPIKRGGPHVFSGSSTIFGRPSIPLLPPSLPSPFYSIHSMHSRHFQI